MNFDLDFYKGKKVFVTGHTGFKGSWLCKMLVNVGAKKTYWICGEGSSLILGDRIFTMIQALSVFCLFKKYMDGVHVGKLAKSISRCSFGIYLIHPFFINLLYKMMNVTPTNFPLLGIEFAIPLLWLIVFLLSWGGTFIMLKVPGLKDLL